ncbi:hypothetical protein EVAR_84909_1 [Eumeta japonica]|uniref:Uncharacterized protein n=1 Tax=Eumeta variegata TaxID=151549 RepID=A0A4C1Z2A9_EUMVA|nr:hypothetical protein EVAR_84909_1 [Eumeta japonica]
MPKALEVFTSKSETALRSALTYGANETKTNGAGPQGGYSSAGRRTSPLQVTSGRKFARFNSTAAIPHSASPRRIFAIYIPLSRPRPDFALAGPPGFLPSDVVTGFNVSAGAAHANLAVFKTRSLTSVFELTLATVQAPLR